MVKSVEREKESTEGRAAWGLYPFIKQDYNPHTEFVSSGGDIFMIVFDKLWVTMKKRGITTYSLREKSGIDSKTVRRLQANDNIETKTLNKLCTALSCKLEDIAEFKEDKE